MANNSEIEACSRALLDVVPEIMQFIRAEMRANLAKGLSVPQFRAMAHLSRTAEASLSMVADHLGLSPAGASSVVDELVRRGYVCRREARADRRRIALSLTAEGRKSLGRARQAALKSLVERLAGLDSGRRQGIAEAMACLRELFLS